MKNSLRHIGLAILLIAASLGVASSAACKETEQDSLMERLEEVIRHRETYVAERERHITELKQRLAAASAASEPSAAKGKTEVSAASEPTAANDKKEATGAEEATAAEAREVDEERYAIIGELFEAYKPFNTDSAYFYSLQREEVARRLEDPVRIMDARMNRATALQAVGMYHEVATIMEEIDPSQLPDYLLPYYFYIMRTLKGNMADFSAFSPIRAKYLAETRAYRDSIISVNEPGSLAHAVSVADQHNAYGQYDKAVDVMTRFMAEHELSDHDKAICAWTLADSYQHLGETDKLKTQLIISSISDLKAAVREYVSLRQLALLLYKEGDFERAYRFMNIAMEDANKSNARQRMVELSTSYPEITEIYVEKIQEQRRSLQKALWIIGILAFVLVLALAYVWKQMRVISASRRQLAEANDSLHSLNTQLTASNDRLNTTNTQLKEANERLNEANGKLNEANQELQESYKKVAENSRLKEAYIGRYMDQCVMQIESLDSFRKSLLKLMTTGKLDELRERLKSTDSLDDRLRGFYENFDRTFLNLFPTFVDDFNSLLLPEEAITPKKKGTLNTELRIFALIRLGINDSDQIARFLRYSVTTIYNYRTKVRNKAKGDRALLEDAVRGL